MHDPGHLLLGDHALESVHVGHVPADEDDAGLFIVVDEQAQPVHVRGDIVGDDAGPLVEQMPDRPRAERAERARDQIPLRLIIVQQRIASLVGRWAAAPRPNGLRPPPGRPAGARHGAAHHPALLGPPVVQDPDVVPDAEVADTEVQVPARVSRVGDLSTRLYAHAEGLLDDHALGRPDGIRRVRTGPAHAQRIVGRPELDHVHALDRQDRVEVLQRFLLLDHEDDDALLERAGPLSRAYVHDRPRIATHPDPV